MEQGKDPFAAFELAISRAGGQSALARMVGCTPGNVSQLVKKRSPLPGRYVLKAEAGTGIPRHELRPDLYPQETPPLPPAPVTGGVAVEAPGVVCNRGATTHREGANDA